MANKTKYKKLRNYITDNKLDLWDVITYVRGKDEKGNIIHNDHFPKKEEEDKDKYFQNNLHKHADRLPFLEYYISEITKGKKAERKKDSLCAAVDIALGVYQGYLINLGRQKHRDEINKIIDLRKYVVGERGIIETKLPKNIRWEIGEERKKEFFEKSLNKYWQALTRDADKEAKYDKTLEILDEWKVFGENDYFQKNYKKNKKTKKKIVPKVKKIANPTNSSKLAKIADIGGKIVLMGGMLVAAGFGIFKGIQYLTNESPQKPIEIQEIKHIDFEDLKEDKENLDKMVEFRALNGFYTIPKELGEEITNGDRSSVDLFLMDKDKNKEITQEEWDNWKKDNH